MIKLPNMTTPFDTVAGLWVKPNVTTTYVVRQEICGNVKWDTVVIYMNPVGLGGVSSSGVGNWLTVFPQPANDFLELKITHMEFFKDFKNLVIINNLGQIVWKEELFFEKDKFVLRTLDLSNGVYLLQLKSGKSETVSKRFVVSR